MTTWKFNRQEVTTTWNSVEERKRGTTSRKYMLGSFFDTIKTAILDPKDDKAIRIKCDPAYYANPEFKNRKEVNTQWKSTRILS